MGLGLNYSSSSSDEIFGGSGKEHKKEVTMDDIASTLNDGGMDEGHK